MSSDNRDHLRRKDLQRPTSKATNDLSLGVNTIIVDEEFARRFFPW